MARSGPDRVEMRLDEIESLSSIEAFLGTPGLKIRFDNDPKIAARGFGGRWLDRDALLRKCGSILHEAPRFRPDRDERNAWAQSQLESMRERGEVRTPGHLVGVHAETARRLAELYVLDQDHARQQRYIESFADFAPASVPSHDYVTYMLDEYLKPLLANVLARASTKKRALRKPEATNYAGLIAEDLADRFPGMIARPRVRTRTGVQKRRSERRARLRALGTI